MTRSDPAGHRLPRLGAALALLLSLHPDARADDPGFATSECIVIATLRSLATAETAFAAQCPTHLRTDCDPAPGGGWSCSSHPIGASAPPRPSPPADARAASAWRRAGSPRPGPSLSPEPPPPPAALFSPVPVPPGDPEPPVASACYTGSGAGGASSGANDASGRSAGGGQDLIALHHDGAAQDYRQAVLAQRMLLDAHPGRAILAAHGSLEIDGALLEGAFARFHRHLPGALDVERDPDGALERAAHAWRTTLDSGARVYVSEGGTSRFTARVLTELESRGVERLDAVTVVRPAELLADTDPADLATVERLATHALLPRDVAVPDVVDAEDDVADFEFATRASCYASSWAYALAPLAGVPRRVDVSGAAALLHILGLDELSDPTSLLDRFARPSAS